MPNTYGLPTDSFETTLTTAITAGASTMVVGSVTGLVINTYLIIDPLLADTIEVVYITAIDVGTKTLTIDRGESGTTGRAHSAGAIVIQTFMADTLVDLEASLGTYLTTQLATKPDLVTAGTAGNTASNAGTATTFARSDHIHQMMTGTSSRAAGSTGSQAITGVGFKPAVVLITAQTSSATAPGCYGVSHGAAKSSSDRHYVTMFRLDTAGEDSVGENLVQTSLVIAIFEEDGTDGIKADFVSLDSDGFTINWTVINHNVTFTYQCFG